MARMRANARMQAERLKAAARQQRILNAKKKGKPLIPDAVLAKLASLNLPPNPWVYDVCLHALMNSLSLGGSDGSAAGEPRGAARRSPSLSLR